MLKVLLKKQMYEMLSGILTNRRTGKRRSAGALAGFAILFAFAGISMSFGFGALYLLTATTLAGGLDVPGQLLPVEYGGLYFAFTGIITLMLGIIGGMFTTYSILYMPRDNELLLSMPVKPSVILASRMLSVYLMIVIYTVLSYVPAVAVFFISSGFRTDVLLMSLVMYIAMTFFVLALSCFLGWLLALIAAKLGSKKVVTVVSVLVTAFAYYFFYFGRNQVMKLITDDPANAVRVFRTTPLLVFFSYGEGSGGSWLYFLIFLGIVAASMSLAMLLLSGSFIALVTTRKGRKKKVYVARTARTNSALGALFRREIKRFVTDPGYFINSGFGSIVFIVAAVIAAFNTPGLRSLIASMQNPAGEGPSVAISPAMLPVTVLSATALVLFWTPISASSVSLEGNRLWILKTMPVSTTGILAMKLAVHELFAGIPAAIFVTAAGIILEMGVLPTVLLCVAALSFAALAGSFGLMLETHNPKLDWTDENVAIKQNYNVLFVMLAGFGITTLFGAFIPICMFFPVVLIPALVFQAAVAAGLSVLFFRISARLWETL